MKDGRWIIYPSTRFISEEKIRLMAKDAIANNECEYFDVASATFEFVCDVLDDIGNVTFAAWNADTSRLQEHSDMDRLYRD